MGIGLGGPTGGADASGAQEIGGLTPGTEYHFRVVASNEIEGRVEITYGPDVTFATQPAAGEGLPDGRAYELVTPPNKGSAEDMFAPPPVGSGSGEDSLEAASVGYPSESGEEFLLETRAAFGSFAASGQNTYVFKRGGTGWQTVPLAVPSLGIQSVNIGVFDPADFSQVGIFDSVGTEITGSSGLQGEGLLVSGGAGSLTTIHSEPEPRFEVAGQEVPSSLLGASQDLGDVVFQSTTLLPAGQDPGTHALYEWSGGALSLLNVDPEGVPFACGATLGQTPNMPGGRTTRSPPTARRCSSLRRIPMKQ